jgi:hypothetical protein
MTKPEGYRVVYVCGAVFVGLGLGEALGIAFGRPPVLPPAQVSLAILEVGFPAYLAVTESHNLVRLGWLLLAALGLLYWALGGHRLEMPWAFLFAALWAGAGAMLMWGSGGYVLKQRMRLGMLVVAGTTALILGVNWLLVSVIHRYSQGG